MTRYIELINLINEANYNYYVLNNPTVSDNVYDRWMEELLLFEQNNQDDIKEDSPSKKVGSIVIDSFEKYEHKEKMLSLTNAFSYNHISSFLDKIDSNEFTCELKIDGLSISLIYENGLFKKAVTRGDGFIGEDVTHNAITIKSIPLKLNKDVNIIVRGEVFMDIPSFNKLNEKRETEGVQQFQNPRNAASGSLRQLDNKVARERNLDTFIFQEVNPNSNSHIDSLSYLKKLGFKTNEYTKKITKDEVIPYIKEMEQLRKSLPYEIDGVVVKVDDVSLREKLGETSRSPRWAIAYKFKEEEAETTLRDIKFTVGRTGVITPNAIFDTVRLDGSEVSKATLHNIDYINNLKLNVNDNIIVKKAGDIIPRVVKVSRKNNNKQFQMIKNCPICDTKLIKDNMNYICPNEFCDSRVIESLIHFTSRDAMNIEGLGERILEDFYNFNFIKDIYDIYNLYNHKEELIKLEGFGEKSIDKILTSIENSKNNSLEKLLLGLGIKGVGRNVSYLLSKEYKTLEKIIEVSLNDQINIKDIGPIIKENLITYFNDNKDLLNKLNKYDINTKYIEPETTENINIKDKTFVITGKFNNYKRKDLEQIILNSGGKTSSSVSKNTDYLLAGENAGSKYNRANQLDVNILNIDEFEELIK